MVIYPREKEKLGVIALKIEPILELRVHISYDYEPELVDYLRSLLEPNISLSVGEDIGQTANYQILVAGRPNRNLLDASPYLHTLIIPWVGLPQETRELLSEYPSISVHNLHHNAAPTAELAMALLFAAAKFIIPYDQTLRQHDWSMRYLRPGPSKLLSGKTALILGYGAIGRRVAKACAALDMTVLVTKRQPNQSSDEHATEIHPPQNLSQLLPSANVLVICLPLTPQTENLIDEKELALLPEESILVNVGRGPIVNEAALYNALRNGRLCAAGLDVWYNYPPDKPSRTHTPAANYPFHELDNIVMSPHRGGDTSEMDRLRMVHLARLVNAVFHKEPVPNKVDLILGY